MIPEKLFRHPNALSPEQVRQLTERHVIGPPDPKWQARPSHFVFKDKMRARLEAHASELSDHRPL